MLTKTQEKLIRSLQTKKGREESGFCLVEGEKVIESAKKFVEFEFASEDTKDFKKLVTTVTPQMKAAVARVPDFDLNDVMKKSRVVVLDGVQDPGNVGSILRLCLGFDAGLLLVESADPTSPKVIRSSAGATFLTPWLDITRHALYEVFQKSGRSVYRLEKRKGGRPLSKTEIHQPLFLIAGSEGQGITLDVAGPSLFIEHDKKLESLNVGHAIAIALHTLY